MSNTLHSTRIFTLVAMLVSATSLLMGDEPSIESVAYPVGQRGTEFRVEITGSGLVGCQDLVFYSDKLACKKLEERSEFDLVATVACSADCPVGNQPFRVLARDGFSELKTLWITPYQVTLEDDARRQTLSLDKQGRTIQGILESGDIDQYRVALAAGERLSAEVVGVRLGYELLDTELSVKGPAGESLAHQDDNPLYQQDAFVSFVAPQDGVYTVEVHESNYDGSDTSFYGLHLGSFPAPAVVTPSGGRFGEEIELTFLDEAGHATSQRVRLPSQPDEQFQLFASHAGIQAPTPVPFRLGNLANFFEGEPNDSPPGASGQGAQESYGIHADSGIALNGILGEPGDRDYFVVYLEKGETYEIQSFADQLGSPADTILTLFDAQNRFLASNDDWGSHDSRLEFTPQDSGKFSICVGDKLGGGRPNAVYRVEVTKVQPRITAFLPRPNRLSQANQTISVPRGNRVMTRVGVRREFGEGIAQLRFAELPKGVNGSPATLPSDQFWVPMILHADSESELGGGLASIVPYAQANNAEIGEVTGAFRQEIDLVHATADQLFHSVEVDRVAVAVTPEIPFKIDVKPMSAGLPLGGTLEVIVELTRNAGFDEPVRVELPFLPPWVVCEPFIVIPKGASNGSFRLEARPQAVPRNWKIVATAKVHSLDAEGDVSEIAEREVASELVDLKIEKSPVTGSFTELAGVQGEVLSATCELEFHSKVPGSLVANLEGLPNRVSCETVTIPLGKSEVKFVVTIADDAPLGTFEHCSCRLHGRVGEQAVSYVVGPHTKLLVAEQGKLKRGSDGKALTRLEALREAGNKTGDSR